MKQLILVRHAKSSWEDETLPDSERPLLDRGRKQARHVGELVAARFGPPQLVLCSPAIRTQETVELALKELGDSSPEVKIVEALYQPDAADYRNIIGGHGGAADRLMVVGHNPHTKQTVHTLAGQGDEAALERLAQGYPTAAVALLEFDIADWWSLAPKSGTLAFFDRPYARNRKAEA